MRGKQKTEHSNWWMAEGDPSAVGVCFPIAFSAFPSLSVNARKTFFKFLRAYRTGRKTGRPVGRQNRMRWGVGGLLIALLTTGVTRAQPVVNQFDHFSVREGLSHNSVNCILQDHAGFLWFGTSNGLNQYDGYSFRVFQPDPTHPDRSFRYNNITGLCEDRAHRLWAVTTGGGLHEVDRRSGVVTPHPIRAANENRWNDQLSVYEDRSGQLWVSTYAGLARYDPARRHFTLYPSPRAETPFKAVYEDRQHRFWVATFRGLYRLDRRTGRFILVPVRSAVSGQDQPVFNSFYEDEQGVLWLGTAGDGLFRIDGRSTALRPEPYNPDGQIRRYLYMNSLHQDTQGFVWFGSTEGLQRVNPVRHQVVTFKAGQQLGNGISSATAQAAYHDRDGTLWVGTNTGVDRQVSLRKPFDTYQPTLFTSGNAVFDNKVSAVLLDTHQQLWLTNQQYVYRRLPGQTQIQRIPPGHLGYVGNHRNHTYGFLPADNWADLWLGTWDGMYAYQHHTDRYVGYPSKVPAQFLSRSTNNLIWLGGEGGIASFDPLTHQYTYYLYDPAKPAQLPDKFIYGLLASRAGDVWVAVKGKGITRLDPTTGRFTHHTSRPGRGQLNDDEVLAFYEDQTGAIWIGTNQGGLNRFDRRTGRFSALTTQDGLPSNHVVGITGDAAGNVWISTDRGLCRVNPSRKIVHSYTSNDGLPSNDFLENAVSNQRGHLYFGTLNGLVHFDPTRIRDDKRPFPVCITALRVMDEQWPLTDSLVSLPYDQNFVSFDFAALTYGMSAENQYAYQLVGVDQNWVRVGSRRFANYTSLAPGRYQFRVKAANSDGFWSPQQASLGLTIRPPWWATWWAYGLYALAFTSVIGGVIRFQINRIRVKQAFELNRREAEQLKAVDEVKTRFFTNITHEFRTPLTLIMAPVTDLLKTAPAGSSTHQHLSMVMRSANHLLQLINQLLDLSKLEAQQMPVALRHGRPANFVGDIVDLFRAAADRQQIAITYTATVAEGECLFDSDKWERIIFNLLSNALKFSEAGGEVTVALGHAEAESSTMQLVISDNGIGIAPDRLPKIFDRFYQVEDSATRQHGGTGIGLALVKELTEVMGGTIDVKSEQNAGTTFILHLLVRPVSVTDTVPEATVSQSLYVAEDGPLATTSQPTDGTQAETVLVVEDSPELRQLVVSHLTDSYRVLQAPDGQTGWQLVQDKLPDVVISDVMMPGMDGYALTRLIKTTPDTSHIAVLLLTAKSAVGSRVEGFERGADEYMSKPFHPEELRLRVRNIVAYQRKLRDRFRQQFIQSTSVDEPDEPLEMDTRRAQFLQKMNDVLTHNIHEEEFNVEAMAKVMDIDRRQLNRYIQTYLKMNPINVIRDFRLHRATELLRKGRSIAQAAYDVGFRNPGRFSTAFKAMHGMTPKEFVAGLQK